MDIQNLYRLFLESSGICTDTRLCCEKSLFFSLRGNNYDGNKFANEALEKGDYFFAQKKFLEQEKLALEAKRNELKEEQKLEKERKLDLQRFIKLEQAELRKERAEKQRQFLEQIKLEKKIDLFRKREELELSLIHI